MGDLLDSIRTNKIEVLYDYEEFITKIVKEELSKGKGYEEKMVLQEFNQDTMQLGRFWDKGFKRHLRSIY